MSFSLGMMGPIRLDDFRQYLYPGQWRDDLPKGLGGTPVNLLSRELLRRGQHLLIISLDPAVRDEIVLEGINLRICIGPFRARRARDFFAAERAYLHRTIAREKPEILHAQWTYEYAMAAQGSGLPHVITAHDAPMTILRHDFRPYRIIRTLMAYRVLSRSSRVVSVSPYVARHLKRFMLYRGSEEIIPNGMPSDLFERINRPRDRRNTFTIATVLSNWSNLKNGAAAIEAFALLKRDFTDVRMIMFGPGYGSGEDAQQWAIEHQSTDGIEFAGLTPHGDILDRLAAEVDILLHPSLEEAQPMPPIEAMALNIPVIGGRDSGGVPWTLNEGRAGILLDVSSAAEIAEVLGQFARSPDECMNWGARGRALAEQRFHMNAVTDAYQSIYKQLAEPMCK